ncbi:MAG: transporter [Chlamydiales bacterium]|jgi:FHS family glucose/mannose:H+ symporter-like MFS transporter|nr:transporter [Chlamydiales bacterium]
MKLFVFISCLIYFLCGAIATTLGSILPDLLAHYDVSYTEGGKLVSLGSLGFLIGVPLSTALLRRFSEKATVFMSILLIALAQLSLFSLPSFGFVMFFNFLNNLGMAAVEIVIASLLMELLVGRRAVVMSYLEVAYGVGALLMPFIASFLISYKIWRFSFLITSSLSFLMLLIWFLNNSYKTRTQGEFPQQMEHPSEVLTSKLRRQLMGLFVLMIFFYTGIEGSINNFLSSIFLSYLHTLPHKASLSIGIFWIAMVIGRLATGWIIRKVDYSTFLKRSMSGTLALLLIFKFWQNEAAGYFLIVLLGLAMSGIYSITMVYANHTFPGKARLVTSLITGFAGLGSAFFPSIVGYTMDHWSVSSALLVLAVLAAFYLLALQTVASLYHRLGRAKAREALPSP